MRPERFRRIREVLARRQPDLTVLMDNVNKAHNFSAILRSCDAVGVLEAHVIAPEQAVEIHHAASAGTKKWVAVRRHRTASEAITLLKEDGFTVLAAHLSPTAKDFRDVDYTRPTAITVGAELHGVSDEALALVDEEVTIPMRGMVQSLNVSVASALLLFEAERQRSAHAMYQQSRLPPEDFSERLFEWAYPALARKMRKQGQPYPALGPDGEILAP